MTLTVSFTDPDEACRWLKHMSRYRPAKRHRPEPAPSVPAEPVTATDHRMQAILDKFHGK